MRKNTVPFQKGLSLADFLAEHGAAEPCEQALLRVRWPDGLRCRSDQFRRISTRRATFQCNAGKRQVSRLAGTLLQSTKLPFTTWFLSMDLLPQTQRGIPALELGRRLGGSDNTAWLLKQKRMQAMLERDQCRRLEGAVQLDDACLGGESPGGRRGRGSESRTPFVVAVEVTEDGRPVAMQLRVLEGFRKEEVGQWARECLEPGTEVHSDGLRCCTGVEAAGCETPGLLWVNTILGNGKRSLDGTCHACAARCLAEFQYRFNRRFDLAAMLRRMLQAAAAAPPLPRPILTAVAGQFQPEPFPRWRGPLALDAPAAPGTPVRRRIPTARRLRRSARPARRTRQLRVSAASLSEHLSTLCPSPS